MDCFEEQHPFRKKIRKAGMGLTFRATKAFDSTTSARDYVQYDSKGNILPRRVYHYAFPDENTFRI